VLSTRTVERVASVALALILFDGGLRIGWRQMRPATAPVAAAPTDPAIMFSVLGRREIAGRTGPILEGEAGANDPVGRRAAGRFVSSLANLAEIVIFVALGLTIGLEEVGRSGAWLDGLALALIGVFLARPLALAPLLALTRLHRNERAFIAWAGLKGAVPILLASFALVGGVAAARRLYLIVFVVVALSACFHAASIPWAARRLGVPMEPRRVDPWE
jgi:NhaP-type Na+/H+ and K+/H+ antiporter